MWSKERFIELVQVSAPPGALAEDQHVRKADLPAAEAICAGSPSAASQRP